MRVIVAPDKFRGSLDANEVAIAITTGILRWQKETDVVCLPVADGGEGTMRILQTSLGGELVDVLVNDPLMRPIVAQYLLVEKPQSAVIELSAASGLSLLSDNEKNCMFTSSYGTGELINHALNFGVQTIYLCVGGSATNDAGVGMLSALGFRFLNADNEAVIPIGKSLIDIQTIDKSEKNPRLAGVKFLLINDVTNVFYGENGAAHIFAPQKGASINDVNKLDNGLRQFAAVVESFTAIKLNLVQGAGAGGGFAGGAYGLLNAEIVSGTRFVLDILNMRAHLKSADLVVTGEGKIDAQTLAGKAIYGISKLASEHNVPVAALCGIDMLGTDDKEKLGLCYSDSINEHSSSMSDSIDQARIYLSEMSCRMMQILEWDKIITASID